MKPRALLGGGRGLSRPFLGDGWVRLGDAGAMAGWSQFALLGEPGGSRVISCEKNGAHNGSNMTPPCYNVEVAYSFKMGYGVDMDAVLADYARGHQAVWVASDCNPRTGKRCNCYVFECPQRAVGFIDGLPDKFDIDEAGITRDGKEFTLLSSNFILGHHHDDHLKPRHPRRPSTSSGALVAKKTRYAGHDG